MTTTCRNIFVAYIDIPVGRYGALLKVHVLTLHQGVLADGKIYIDGGNTYMPKYNGTFSTTDIGDWTAGMSVSCICET